MSEKAKHFPSPDQILAFLKETPGKVGKKEIARAFGIRGDDRIELKKILKSLKEQGEIEKGDRKTYSTAGDLPETLAVRVTGVDHEGDLIARPFEWKSDKPMPQIILTDPGKVYPAPAMDDLLLAKVFYVSPALYHGKAVRRLSDSEGRIVGVFEYRKGADNGYVKSADRRIRQSFLVEKKDMKDAKNGEVVLAELLGNDGKKKTQRARIVRRLGDGSDPKSATIISLYQFGVPVEFSPNALALADKAAPAPTEGRTDLRSLPFVTVDGEDARDFDDAVYAGKNDRGGYDIIIAIADVAYYVRPDNPLDRDAKERGNSVYFPDRAVPMLPPALSGDLCSLRPGVDRSCMAAFVTIDGKGKKLSHRFGRVTVKSAARLNYHEVQDMFDGKYVFSGGESALQRAVFGLKEVYGILRQVRKDRGALEIEGEEKEIKLDDSGHISRISPRERLDSHRMIEELMILANVCAAETLEELRQPVMYRVHEPPSDEKVNSLRLFLKSMGVSTTLRAEPHPKDFNKILESSKYSFIVNDAVLRTQSQARYSPENMGHFGLALEKYAHFTSPIRRYADLLVHRALITGLKLGVGGLVDHGETFEAIGEHLSMTERRADQAERAAEERYISGYLTDRIGEVFPCKIRGISRSGLYVLIEGIGAEGFVPMSSLAGDFYVYDEERQTLQGERTHKKFTIGDPVSAVLRETMPLQGGMIFEIVQKGQGKPNRPQAEQQKQGFSGSSGDGKKKHEGKRPGKKRKRRRP